MLYSYNFYQQDFVIILLRERSQLWVELLLLL
jgi:hypothetical protein